MEDIINVNGKWVYVRYTDDAVIFVNTEEGLQRMMEQVNNVSEKCGMKLKTKKTKVMMVRKNSNKDIKIRINGEILKLTRTFSHLGCTLNDKWNHSIEIRTVIEKA